MSNNEQERSRLSLGGWFTLLNCLSWPILVAVEQHNPGVSPQVLGICELVLGFPCLLICLAPHPSGISDEGMIVLCVLIGFNSFLWGYGLAAIVRMLFAKK